jgi:RNA polymerase sigma-70 factor (ECF subfamily)
MRRPSDSDFLKLYDEHADAIFRFCFVQTSDRERAKDAVQETFVRTWKYMAGGKSIDKVKPFLYRIARNILIDAHRRDRTESLDNLTDQGFDVADGTDLSVTAEATLAVQAMSRLEPSYREAVSLRYVHDLSPAEIAHITGERENTVSVRIHRGLEQLKELLQPNK